MREQYVEALLYDWHNQHKLRNQRLDLEYWLTLVPRSKIPSCWGREPGEWPALWPRARLPSGRRRPESTPLGTYTSRAWTAPCVCRHAPTSLSRAADQVVVPYSTFQLLRTAEDRNEHWRKPYAS